MTTVAEPIDEFDTGYSQPETDEQAATAAGPKPVFEGGKKYGEQTALYIFVVLPFLAALAAIPLGWGGWLSWTDVILFVAFYIPSGLGITVGYHRLFTHGSFKAKPWLRVVMAVCGMLAIEGPLTRWVADHRRHHAYSDRDGDPHSPWRYGPGVKNLTRGLFWAHLGWMFDGFHSNREKYVPDLLADKALVRVDKLFALWVGVSLLLPGVLGGLISWSWQGGIEAFFWAGLVRVFLLHHVTWSINSVCHAVGKRPFVARDRSTNVWPLAVLSFGESYHNMHHADPTAARHGVLRGQIDESARLIWIFEKFGWAWDVRWPQAERLAKLKK